MNKFKKVKIILVNIFIIVVILIACDFLYSNYLFNNFYNKINNLPDVQKKFYKKIISGQNKYLIHIKKFETNYDISDYIMVNRIFKVNEEKKGSILIFGCSFAHGAYLNKEDTFSYKLSKLTDRTVINYAIPACGFGHMLWQTKYSGIYKYIDEHMVPEYAIYIYIPDHLIRSCHYKYGVSDLHSDNYYLSYELKNGKLVETNPVGTILAHSAIIRDFIKNKICTAQSPFGMFKDEEKNFDFIKAHFIESREELWKHYPNLKFIIIKYPYNYDENMDYTDNYEEPNMKSYSSSRWKELEDEGFIIYELNKKNVKIDVNDKKFQLPDGHPNGNAWEYLTPLIIKKFNL